MTDTKRPPRGIDAGRNKQSTEL